MHSNQNYMYVAMGLSSDTRMNDDSVMECVKEGSGVRHYTSFTGFEDRFQTAWRDEEVNSSCIEIFEIFLSSEFFY